MLPVARFIHPAISPPNPPRLSDAALEVTLGAALDVCVVRVDADVDAEVLVEIAFVVPCFSYVSRPQDGLKKDVAGRYYREELTIITKNLSINTQIPFSDKTIT